MFTSRDQAIKAVATLIVERDSSLLPVVNGLLTVFGRDTVAVKAPAAMKASSPKGKIYLDSSTIDYVQFTLGRRFDARRPNLKRKPNLLIVAFNSGAVYQYTAVPERIFNELIVAESAGSYFSENIRDEYKTKKLVDAKLATA